MIRNQYLFYIHSLGCNTPIQFSFLQSWDICAAAEPIMLSLLCKDSYAIKILQKKIHCFHCPVQLRALCISSLLSEVFAFFQIPEGGEGLLPSLHPLFLPRAARRMSLNGTIAPTTRALQLQ